MDLITTTEAATILGVTTRTIRRMATDGRLTPALTLPTGYYLFNRADVETVVRPVA